MTAKGKSVEENSTDGASMDWSKVKREKVAELRLRCEAAGLDASGTKPVLLARLREHFGTSATSSAETEDESGSGMETDASTKSMTGRRRRRGESTSETTTTTATLNGGHARGASRSPSPAKLNQKKSSESDSNHLKTIPEIPSENAKLESSKNKTITSAAIGDKPQSIPAAAQQKSSKSSNETNENHEKAKGKKQRRKKKGPKVIERNTLASVLGRPAEEDSTTTVPPPDVEVEYVPVTVEQMGLASGAPEFQQFSEIFAKFTLPTGDEEADENNADDSAGTDAKKKAATNEPKTKDELLQEFFADSDQDMDVDDEEGEDEGENKIAKRKLRKLRRMNIAQLKQMVQHPEAVEWVDVTAADPLTLVHLKSYRNTVPIPVHWSAKRKYLQGKRGIEKPPFELPEYIRDTGIAQMRQAIAEKEENMSMKQKMRAKMQPKMGKLEIDYQKLHDAFFRFQTKPHLTVHGELYREGKEFQTKTKEKRPGVLSPELREALGMQSELVPPPWLLAQQRFGPPPNYPNLRIPGLNAPIPEGAQWGYHPGGWGKPPVDEYGRPLYGDVFGMYQQYQQQLQAAIMTANLAVPIERELWGELEPVEEVEEEEDEEDDAGSSDEAEADESTTAAELEDGKRTQITSIDIQGLATPSGTVSSYVPGLKTPQVIELRKERIPSAEVQPTKHQQLYTVLEQKDSKIRGMMGSQHTYDLQGDKKKRKFGETPEESLGGAVDESAFSLEREESVPEATAQSTSKADAAASKKRKTTEDKRRLQDFKF